MDDLLDAAREVARQLALLRESGDIAKQNSKRAIQLVESIEGKTPRLPRKAD